MEADNEEAYEAHAWRCHACATRETKAKSFDDKAGLLLTVERSTHG